MKRIIILSFIAVFGLSVAACSTTNTISANSNTSTDQSAVEVKEEPTTEEYTSEELTTEDPTTEVPTEDPQETANHAYLEYLQEHSDWFSEKNNDFLSIAKTSAVALCDVNGDGVDELIHVRPYTERQYGEMNLCILTYNNGIQSLYDDYFLSIPGAEAGYSVFMGNDSKLYSITAKELNGSVIRFDVDDGSSLLPIYLADSKAHHLAEPSEAVCHADGSVVTFDEFYSYRSGIEDKVKTYLLINYQNSRGAEDISMSYDEACSHLK